jgi:DNA-binding protein WhiA
VSAAFLCEIAAADGSSLAVAERSTHAVAYAKGWEAIESVLALMGASETVLALEERAVVAETSARANRLANADHANLVRTSRAARLQLDAVEHLRDADRLEQLPHSLREAAELRLRHPSESLRELAARTNPPATKAAVYRRFRRLEGLAGPLK